MEISIYDLLKDPIFNTPTEYDGDFLPHVEKILTQYLTKLKSVSAITGKGNGNSISGENMSLVISRQEKFINGLIKTIELYLDGQPALAYILLYNTLNIDNKEQPGIRWRVTFYAPLYRARVSNETELFMNELFHISFAKRGLVKNQRFSIAGTPSLYLSNNLYTCWKELGCPNLNSLHYVQMHHVPEAPVRFLNLIWDIDAYSLDHLNWFNSLMKWPLIALCTIKVKNPSDNFKPEYILPQLLLQWVRNHSSFDGIAYDSTHIDKNNTPQKGAFTNVVLPAKESKSSGYCLNLASRLQSTKPLSAGKILLDENNFINQDLKLNTSSSTIIVESEIEPGAYITYDDSVISKLEGYSYKFSGKKVEELLVQ
ncbi:hypothetical protein [Hymenobacter sp. B1770]|uniref:hypothetical protein n=1 Tax=Hymenobacter sp. B1770 TaxID=1718788 RepID=UPI003CF124AF